MSVLVSRASDHLSTATAPIVDNVAGRQRQVERATNRVRRDGKFFRLGSEKFYVKGVTYGPFKPDADGLTLASPAQTRRDFELMLEMGANCLRIYHTPPAWFLDLAQEMGLKIFLDVAWAKNLTFIGDAKITAAGSRSRPHCRPRLRQSPGDLRHQRRQRNSFGHRPLRRPRQDRRVHRRAGHDRQERSAGLPGHLRQLSRRPNTSIRASVDFVCFNVYLHDDAAFRNYLARLQNIAGEKPLMLGEYGIDTFREHSPENQAEILSRHVRAVFDEGLVGTFIFSFTDDWHRHGYQIEDWAFGISRAGPHAQARVRGSAGDLQTRAADGGC